MKYPECLVSIVTIVFNDLVHIEQTINSVLMQTYRPIEYIVIDGGSTDGTVEIIEKYIDQIDHFVSEPDDGIYDAINKGISLASGDLIGLIHSGDYYESGAVSVAVDSFLSTGADVVHGNLRIIEDFGGKCISRIIRGDHNSLKKRMTICHSSTFVSKRCYSQHGLFNLKYKSVSDYDFFLKLFLSGVKFHHIDKVLANFRVGGLSGSNFRLSMKENFCVRQGHLGKLKAFIYLFSCYTKHYYFTGRKWFIKKCIGENTYFRLKQLYYKKQ